MAHGSFKHHDEWDCGCKLSGAVEQTLAGPGEFIEDAKVKAVGKDMADLIPGDDLFKQKREWPGKFSK